MEKFTNDMEKLMDETTDFLSTANNGNYEILCATAVDRLA